MRNTIFTILALIVFAILGILFTGYQADIPADQIKQQYANAKSQFVKVDGMQVHYRIEGEGPDLVLIHGTAASLHTWDDWTRILKDEFRIIRMDIPAFGITGPHPEADYTLDSYVEFMDHFLEAIQVESCHMAGNSLGGEIAWQYALDRPEKVNTLILIDPAGYLEDRNMPMVIRLAQKPYLAWLFKILLPKAFIKKNIKEVYHDDSKITDALIDRYHIMALRTGNRQAFVDRANTPRVDRTNELGNIQHETLIQWGKYDQWIPLKHGENFDRDIPNSKLIVYENAGHVPMEEIPEETAEDARLFLIGE